ncbi:MAG: sugar ABC transporter substrate-binding protein [Treponema sp.]|jgi:ribose transport system substrate-binding protein|nr:sugar ABC transporter substrate-binding protein [Treponema sp.]
MKCAKRILFIGLALLLAAGTVFAGGGGQQGGGAAAPTIANSPLAGKRIGVAHITLYDEWCKGVYDDFIRIGKEYGVAEMNIQNGDLNAETQQKQVEDFITQKYDLIFIDPVSPNGIKATLDKAAAAGIPVIAFDSGTDWTPLISHIAWDHAETGRLTGRYLADYAKKNLGGKIKVGILAMLDAPHTAIRSQTFKETLEAGLGKANIQYVFEQDFGQTRESATNIVTNNIAKPIDVIWGAVDNAAFGARVALQTNGVRGTKVVSAGAWGKEPFSTLAAKDSYYMMCIGVPPEGIVRKSMETAAAYFSGNKNIPREQNIDLAVVDESNIANYRSYY